MTITTQPKIRIFFAFFAIYLIWGSTYLLNKIAVGEIAPMYLAAFRFICSGILIFIIAKFLKLNLRITRIQFKNSAIAGFLFLTYGNGVFVWALKYVDTGVAALLASTQPLFIILLMRILYGQKFLPKSIIGVFLGIVGMYLLVSQQQIGLNEKSMIGIIMILSCVLGWSYAYIFVAKGDVPTNFFVNTGYQMISGGVQLIIVSFVLGETWVSPLKWSTPVQFSMVLLIVFGSIVAYTSFNYLLKVISAEKVATSAYVNPIVALFLGWYVLDEYISIQSIIAAFILLIGVYFINRKKRLFK